MSIQDFDSHNLPGGMTLEITHRVERESGSNGSGEGTSYCFLDYVFEFDNGRLIAARTYLDTFAGQTEIGLCGCWEEGNDENLLGEDCADWPEFRTSLIAMKALGYAQILLPGEEEYVVCDLSDLKISQDDIDSWAAEATAMSQSNTEQE